MAGKKPSHRAFKVADQIQRDLTQLLARLKDPRLGLLTGTPEQTQAALDQEAGFLRNGLFKRLQIHTVPTLPFVFDRSCERAADMNALIAKAVSTRAKED